MAKASWLNLRASRRLPFPIRGSVIAKMCQQHVQVIGDSQNGRIAFMQKAFGHHPRRHLFQRIEIAVHVEDAASLPMNAKLRPCPLLEKLVERSGAAREGNETVGKLGHFCL